MGVISNYSSLATTPERKIVLDLVETALNAIQPQAVLTKELTRNENTLIIQDKQYQLDMYDRIFLIGFGKGSSGVCKYIEKLLGEKLTQGFDIDVVDETFTKVMYTKGTHPLPSQQNIDFTKQVLEQTTNLTEKDLVLVVICGGGSALFELPFSLDLQTMDVLVNALEKSNATIQEMNIIRKHLSQVKGGGLAKHLYPAQVLGLIFSDVPGNDLSTIASGPTVKDQHSLADVEKIIRDHTIDTQVTLPANAFTETPTEDIYFEHVTNSIMISNQTALTAMQTYAQQLQIPVRIFTDKLQGETKTIGQKLIEETKAGEILLVGGETTTIVKGTGKGGRNQSLVLSSLSFLSDKTVLCAFDSDGWDYTTYAGAIGDTATLKKAQELGLAPQKFLDNDDSTTFFEKVGDGILTGKLESNVSDLFIIYKPI